MDQQISPIRREMAYHILWNTAKKSVAAVQDHDGVISGRGAWMERKLYNIMFIIYAVTHFKIYDVDPRSFSTRHFFSTGNLKLVQAEK